MKLKLKTRAADPVEEHQCSNVQESRVEGYISKFPFFKSVPFIVGILLGNRNLRYRPLPLTPPSGLRLLAASLPITSSGSRRSRTLPLIYNSTTSFANFVQPKKVKNKKSIINHQENYGEEVD